MYDSSTDVCRIVYVFFTPLSPITQNQGVVIGTGYIERARGFSADIVRKE